MHGTRRVTHRLFASAGKCLATLALVGAAALPARAQDSLVRLSDAEGRPLMSVLGTGIGLPYARLALELPCPTPHAWIIEVTGIQTLPGADATFGFADPEGGFTGVRATAVGYGADRLRLSVDRLAFLAALARARAAYPDAEGPDARVVVEEVAGVAVRREALAEEMAALARDCEAPPRRVAAR